MRIIGTNRETGQKVIAELRKKKKMKLVPKYVPLNPRNVA